MDRGEPVTFRSNIPGWTEALQPAKVGDKWQLVIPSKLRLRRTGRRRKIARTASVFDVELLGIEGGDKK